jgi:hypothetical protein
MNLSTLPISIDSPSSAQTPEHALWQSVLWIAIEDARGKVKMIQRHQKEILRRDAMAWLNSPKRDVGDFLWICDLLNLSPQKVRRAIFSIAPSTVAYPKVS